MNSTSTNASTSVTIPTLKDLEAILKATYAREDDFLFYLRALMMQKGFSPSEDHAYLPIKYKESFQYNIPKYIRFSPLIENEIIFIKDTLLDYLP